MDVQSIFYTLASIFMFLGIILLASLLFVVLKAYQAVMQAQKSLTEMKDTVEEKVTDFVSSRPAQVAQVLGTGFSAFLIKKIKDLFKKMIVLPFNFFCRSVLLKA